MTKRNDISHAAAPGDFPAARFVATVIDGPSFVMEQRGLSAPVRVAGPFQTARLADLARVAMNRAEKRCRFCHTDDCGVPCHGCGME